MTKYSGTLDKHIEKNPINFIDPNRLAQVYFLYVYKSDSKKDQKMKNRELNSIKQEVKYLRENGLEVVVDYDATKQDVLDAFTDQEARMIVISGHGKRSAMIQTSDDKRLTPYDLKYINVSKNLETVIFENCHQGDYISDWKKELPKETNVIGWRDKTSVLETKRFNGLGWFDRQPGNLQDQANKIVNNYLRKFK